MFAILLVQVLLAQGASYSGFIFKSGPYFFSLFTYTFFSFLFFYSFLYFFLFFFLHDFWAPMPPPRGTYISGSWALIKNRLGAKFQPNSMIRLARAMGFGSIFCLISNKWKISIEKVLRKRWPPKSSAHRHFNMLAYTVRVRCRNKSLSMY